MSITVAAPTDSAETSPEPQSKAVSWDSVVSIYLPALVLALGVGIALPAIPLLAQSFNVSFGVASFVVTAFLIGGMVGTLPTGWMIDRFGRQTVMIAGPLLTSGLALAVLLSRSFPQLLVFRFLDGWAGQMWLMGRMTGIAASTAPGQRGRQITWMLGMDNTGRLVGPLIGGFIAAAWGPRSPFGAYAILALVALISNIRPGGSTSLSLARLRPNLAAPRSPHLTSPAAAGEGPVGPVPRRSVPLPSSAAADERVGEGSPKRPQPTLRQLVLPRWPLFVLIFFSAMARTPIFSGLIYLYAAFAYHLDARAIGILAAASGALTVPVGILAGYLSDRNGRKRTIAPGFAGVTLLMLGLAVTAFLQAPFVWFVGVFMVALFFQSLCAGSSQTIGADVAPPEARGKFLGIWQFINLIGNSLSPVVFAFVADRAGYGWSFVFVSAAGLAVLTLLITIVPETGGQRTTIG